MLAVLEEVVQRYARHPSFSGIAIRLSADGYAQLPGPDWGLDDQPSPRSSGTETSVPGDGPDRFARRAAFLAQEPHRRLWIEWRADRLSDFYLKAQKLLLAVRSDSRLYLAGAEIIGGEESQTELKPALSHHNTIADLYLHAGIDVKNFQSNRQLVFFARSGSRPAAVSPPRRLNCRSARCPTPTAIFKDCLSPAVCFSTCRGKFTSHRSTRKAPSSPVTPGMVSQPSPRGRRIAAVLSTIWPRWTRKPCSTADGCCPWARKTRSANWWPHIARCRPCGFQQVIDPQSPSQPVTFRVATYSNRTYLYAVNDAPFRVTARIHVETQSNCRLEELTGLRKVAPLKPTRRRNVLGSRLEPYDLVAVAIKRANIQIARAASHVAENRHGGIGRRDRSVWAQGGRPAQPAAAASARKSRFRKTRRQPQINSRLDHKSQQG